jgi:hypothetical protein
VTITLWDGLDHLNLLVGADFPEADEDALRRCASMWLEAARQLRELRTDGADADVRVAQVLGGDAGDAFGDLWTRVCAPGAALDQLATACDQLGDACAEVADAVEYAKIEYIGALLGLGATLAYLLGSAVMVGVSAGAVPVAIAAAQLTIRTVLIRLAIAVTIGCAMSIATDAVAQATQLVLDHRQGWDWTKTWRAAEDGVIAGVAGGAAFIAAGRLAPGLLGNRLGVAGVSASGGLAAGLAVPLAHGQLPSGRDLALAMSSGAAAGLIPHTHRDPSPPADLPGARRPWSPFDRTTFADGTEHNLLRSLDGPASTTLSEVGLSAAHGAGSSHGAGATNGAGSSHGAGATNGAGSSHGAGAANNGAGSSHGAGAAHDTSAAATEPLTDDLSPCTDEQAAEVMDANAFRTKAGLAFYAPEDEIRLFAQAVAPTDGFLTLDLHGSAAGFHIGSRLLTPEQLARGLRQLLGAGAGLLDHDTRVKLLSCDTAVGGDASPAARLARALGVEVIAPDRPVWTGLNGAEIVASAVIVDGVWQPKQPPDGSWQVFQPQASGAPPGIPT